MPEKKTKRCFLAIPIDQACRDDLVEALANVDLPGIRRVASENMHLTLKFLGDVADEFLPQVLEAMNAVMAERSGFDLEVIEGAWFPNDRRPRVLAAECQGELAILELAEAIDVAMNDLGFPLEGRAFRPHITIGRMKCPPRGPLPEIALPSTGCRAEKVILYESRLLPDGPQYTAMAEWALG